MPGAASRQFLPFLGRSRPSTPAGFSGAEPKTRKVECGTGGKWPLRGRPRLSPRGPQVSVAQSVSTFS